MNDSTSLLNTLNAVSDKYIKSWADLYAIVKNNLQLGVDEATPHSMLFGAVYANAFVMALEALPEETDAVNIAKKMNELLVNNECTLGIEVHLAQAMENPDVETREAVVTKLKAMTEFLSSEDNTLRGTIHQEGIDIVPAAKTKTVH